MRGYRTIIAFVGLLALSAPWTGRALAEGAPPEAQAAFVEGKRLYDAGAKAEAVEKFKEAFRLSKNDLLLYNIALVYDEIGDRPLALHYYTTFLDKSKGNERAAGNRKLAAERVVALKKSLDAAPGSASAGAESPGAATAEEPAAEEPPRRRKQGSPLQHEAIENAQAGRPIVITAYTQDPKWEVTLYYRASGQENFSLIPMQPRDAGDDMLVAKIPPAATGGSSVHYYVEAKDAADKTVASIGNSGSPNVVMLEGGDDERAAILAEGEDGDEARKPKAKNRTLTWIVTGSSAALLLGSAVSYMSWVKYQNKLNDELEDCTTTPCQLDSYEQDLADGRDRWKTMTYATFTLGLVGAGVSGYLWYRELKSDEPRSPRVAILPVVGNDGYAGGAALFTF